MRRYLVVANQTLGSNELYEEVRACLASGPCTFHIVVPATPPTEHLTWTEGEAHALARDRLEPFPGFGSSPRRSTARSVMRIPCLRSGMSSERASSITSSFRRFRPGSLAG
jgi:hypothetical protein